jgi:hypothetical protein
MALGTGDGEVRSVLWKTLITSDAHGKRELNEIFKQPTSLSIGHLMFV